jgi:hypothetical protein
MLIGFYFLKLHEMGLLRLRMILCAAEAPKGLGTAVLSLFFARLLVVFLVMWVPSLFMIWVFGYQSGLTAFIGGSWSHLQGLVSAVFYLHKEDIFSEVSPEILKHLCLCPSLVGVQSHEAGLEIDSWGSSTTQTMTKVTLRSRPYIFTSGSSPVHPTLTTEQARDFVCVPLDMLHGTP